MKRVFVLGLFFCAFTCGLYAQAVDTTVCDVVKNPASFNGKLVRLKGTVIAGLDQFMVTDSDCGFPVNGIWLSYPQGTKAKAGPVAMLQLLPAHNFAGSVAAPARTPVTLEKSKDFKQFDSLLAQSRNKGAGVCLGCTRYEVNATLVGRLDSVADTAIKHDKDGKALSLGGFGNMNAYPARLVLQSVSGVSQKEVDFSTSDAATKSGTIAMGDDQGFFDPLTATQKAAANLGSSPAGLSAQKDAAEYGKPGNHNSATGVFIANGIANEVSPKENELNEHDSPDGIIYNCTFNTNRLDHTAQVMAMLHLGHHISDLRSPEMAQQAAPPYVLEYNAWMITTAAAMNNGIKYLTMPGGFLVWDTAWPPADTTAKIIDSLSNFLSKEAYLSR
jgi:hypothetical protein